MRLRARLASLPGRSHLPDSNFDQRESMAEPGGAPRNLDFFGTFLKTVARGDTLMTPAPSPVQAPSPRTVLPGMGAESGQVPPEHVQSALDVLVRVLGQHGSGMSVKDLVLATGWTLGVLSPYLLQLQRFGLAQLDGRDVRLTADGEELAVHALGSTPSGR